MNRQEIEFKLYVDAMCKEWSTRGNKRIVESIKNPNCATIDTGKIGEEWIRIQAHAKGYNAVLTDGSRTPADVWFVKTFDNYIHLGLIQVKTTESENLPAELTEKEEKVLERFPIFIAQSPKINIILKNFHIFN